MTKQSEVIQAKDSIDVKTSAAAKKSLHESKNGGATFQYRKYTPFSLVGSVKGSLFD